MILRRDEIIRHCTLTRMSEPAACSLANTDVAKWTRLPSGLASSN